MSLPAVLNEVRSKGVRLIAEGDGLRVRGPKKSLSPALLERLRQEKAQLLPLISSADYQFHEVSWRLSAEGPGWAVVFSHAHGERVVFIREEGIPLPPAVSKLVGYTREELAILVNGTKGSLRELHRVKKALPGSRVTSLSSVGERVVPALTP